MTDRRKAYDQRQKQRGIIKIAVRVPESRREDLLKVAERMRRDYLKQWEDQR